MTSRNIEKKENGSHALVQEDDIQISDSARKLVETARNKVAKWLRCYFFTTKGGMTSDPTARKAINNVITREALINCDFSGNVLDEVDQAQVYIRDAIIVLAKEIWYCIDSLTNRKLQGLLYFCVINKEGDTLSNQNKIKYDSAYISYVANGDSAAVFIVRDVVRSIDTSGMWIDVISTSGHKNKFDQWDFSSITIELFPRKTEPIYPPNASTEDKKYITWKAANEDIAKQRSQGYRGKKFTVCPKLVNKNQGKTKTIEKIWNKEFGRYVPKHWARTSDCEVHIKKVPIQPAWEYHIISIKRL